MESWSIIVGGCSCGEMFDYYGGASCGEFCTRDCAKFLVECFSILPKNILKADSIGVQEIFFYFWYRKGEP